MKVSFIYWADEVIIMRWLLIFFVLLFGVFTVSGGGPVVSVTDGYVYDMNGNAVSGATVTAQDYYCEEAGCKATTTSQADGYYILGNYNFISKVKISAKKGTSTGLVIAIPDQFNNIHADVTLCDTPSMPLLMPVSAGRDNVISFEWESGIDPNRKSKYDEFKLNSNIESKVSSPLSKEVNLGQFIWGIRTCNTACCSEWTTSNFGMGNSRPSEPVGDYTDLGGGVISFTWTSGVDPDGDPTRDEFKLGDEEVIVSATSPIVALSDSFLLGKVRTCDNYNYCSEWVDIVAVTCEEISPTCPDLGVVEDAVQMSMDSQRALSSEISEPDDKDVGDVLDVSDFNWWLILLLILILFAIAYLVWYIRRRRNKAATIS